MKRGELLSGALLMVLAGCATVHTVDFTGESGTYYQVTTVDDRRSYGRDLVRTPDSILWTDATGRRRALARSKVAEVERVPQPAGHRHWSEWFAEINTRARRRQARVTLLDGSVYLADHLQAARDTTTWFDPGSGALYRAATASIETIRFKDGKRGALHGLATGAAVGALSGAALGFAGGDDPEEEWFAFTAGEKAVLAGLVLGVLGAPVGAIAGSASTSTFRFSRPLLPATTAQGPSVAAPVVSPPSVADIPEAERPAVRPFQRAKSTWTVSVLGAGTIGAARGLEDALRTTGFGESSECFFCSGTVSHPHSSGRGGWLLNVHRRVRPNGKIGLLISRTGGHTLGYDGHAILFIDQTVTTYAPVFSLQVEPILRLGLGPALYRIGAQQTSGGQEAMHRRTRLGFVADLALTFPAHTRFYLDLRAQYRLVGSVKVGPFEEHLFDHTSVFPASRVGFSHGFVGAGFGTRF